MPKRKRIEELYYIRGIAALGILIIHATGGFVVLSEYNSNAMKFGVFLNQFFRYGSPIFMMISGLVLFYNYRSFDEFDAKSFYIKKLKYIVIPYIFWSFVYFLYPNIINKTPINGEKIAWFFKSLLSGSTFSHLYFIPLICQFYILFPLMIKFLVKPMEKKPFNVFITFACIQGVILIYGYYFKNPDAQGFLRVFNRYYWKSFLSWCFYFITGGIIGVHYEKVASFIEKNIKKITVGYIIALAWYVGNVYMNIYINESCSLYGKFGSIRPHTMIYALLSMTMLIYMTRNMIKKELKINKMVKTFGTYSMGIYFAHPLVLEEIKRFLMNQFPRHIGYGRLSSLVLIVLLGWILTFLFVLLLGMTNIRWLFIGKVPRYRIGEKKTKESVGY